MSLSDLKPGHMPKLRKVETVDKSGPNISGSGGGGTGGGGTGGGGGGEPGAGSRPPPVEGDLVSQLQAVFAKRRANAEGANQ